MLAVKWELICLQQVEATKEVVFRLPENSGEVPPIFLSVEPPDGDPLSDCELLEDSTEPGAWDAVALDN